MTRLAIVRKIELTEDFPEAATDSVAAKAKPYIQQQQMQDPDWLAEIKKQQQQGQSWQL